MSQLIVDKLEINTALTIPSYTTAQRDSLSVGVGALIYNTDEDGGLQVWDGSEWVGLAGGAGLYDFINVTFSSGVTGAIGPTISQARAAMSGQGVNLWNTNTLYYNVDSNGVQSWTVPKSGVYRITAAGAKGGEGNAVNSGRPSGNGAIIRGEFQLEEGEVYNIIAGVKPNTSGDGGGGGGGSFVWSAGTGNPLIIGGGGGGNGDVYQGSQDRSTGRPGNTGTQGTNAKNGGAAQGGSNGNGGSVDNSDQGPGAGGGFLTGGASGSSGADGGTAATAGGRGGNSDSSTNSSSTNCGGYGGGGGESFNGNDAEGAGGGGGYSGGGASGQDDPGGGGGGSFLADTVSNPFTSDGSFSITGSEPHPVYSGSVGDLNQYNSGQGYVSITFVQ